MSEKTQSNAQQFVDERVVGLHT